MKKFFKLLGFLISVITAVAAVLCGIGYFFKSKKEKIENIFVKSEKKNEDE